MDAVEYDVFVSHGQGDRQAAQALAESLRSVGARVFLDIDSLDPGAPWREVVQDAIAQSKAIVVLVSSAIQQHGFASEEIRAALRRARSGEALLIPVYLDERLGESFQELRKYRGITVEAGAGLRPAALQIADALEESGRSLAAPHPAVSPVIPVTPVPYVDTGYTDILITSIRLSSERSLGPIRVVGPPGVGKTTLVAEVCHRLSPELHTLWWVRAGAVDTAVDDLASLASHLRIAPRGSREDRAHAAVAYLSHSSERWLVVFDDASRGIDIDRWIPDPSASGTAIVISREPPERHGRTFVLEPLNEEASVRFLRRLLGNWLDDERAEVDTLVAAARGLGGLPLALAMAAAILRRSTDPSWSALRGLIPSDAGAPHASIRSVIEAALVRAFDRSAEMALLISAAAWTADADFPITLLFTAVTEFIPESSAERLDTALEELAALGIADLSPSTIYIHPLVKALAREQADRSGIGVLVEALATGLAERPDEATWGTPRVLLPHLMELATVLNELDSGDVARAVEVLRGGARFLEVSGQRDAAVDLLERTLNDSERIVGPDHPSTLMVRANLASAYQSLGRNAEAVELLERTLIDSERILGPDHQSTLLVRANLASAYRSAGRTTEAIAILEQVAGDTERILGPDHASTLSVRGNLASSYWSAGRTADAIPILEQVARDTERILGGDHPSALTARANLNYMLDEGQREAHT